MAPSLPDEILVKVIKQSIEPYNVFLEPISGGYFIIGRPHHKVVQTEFHRAPSATNLRMVNKMFNTEVPKISKSKFDGVAYIDIHSKDWPSKSLLSEPDHEWLKYDIVDLHIHGSTDWHEDEADGHIWHPTSIPHLKTTTIWLSSGSWLSETYDEPSIFALMSSFASEKIQNASSAAAVRIVDMFLTMYALPISLKLAELEHRGVKIFFKVNHWRMPGEMVRYSLEITDLQCPQHRFVNITAERCTQISQTDTNHSLHV